MALILIIITDKTDLHFSMFFLPEEEFSLQFQGNFSQDFYPYTVNYVSGRSSCEYFYLINGDSNMFYFEEPAL